MKLAVVFPVMNQHDLAKTAVDFAASYMERAGDVLVLDNASDPEFTYPQFVAQLKEMSIVNDKVDGQSVEPGRTRINIARFNKNIGVYPTFWEALKHTDADVLAFLHSDLIICEKGYDQRILRAFEENPKIGLIGFIGSDEIDPAGGRGGGTTSNFQDSVHMRKKADGENKVWRGSPAEAHGKRYSGYTPAAVVDGCAMVFRREVLEKIKQRADFPPHHFYDRLLSCETREAGYEVGVMGIGCDHISGQTANTQPDYGREWAEAHGLTKPDGETWDRVIYLEAERQWLSEYRDTKQFIPCKV